MVKDSMDLLELLRNRGAVEGELLPLCLSLEDAVSELFWQ